MTQFWGFAAGLTVLALLFILPPLLRRPKASPLDENQINLALFRQQLAELEGDLASGNLDQERYQAARRDLEKELLTDIQDTAPVKAAERSGRWAALLLTLLVPLLAGGLYLTFGNQGALEPLTATLDGGTGTEGMPTGPGGPPMEELVTRLAKRMESDPDNLDGWVMLGRSYMTLKRPADAIQALEQARRLAPQDAEILMALAEAVIEAQGSLQGRPAELAAQVLALSPDHPNGLWLSGIINFQQERYAEAVAAWSRLQPQIQPGSEDAGLLQEYLQEARKRAGQGGLAEDKEQEQQHPTIPPETPAVVGTTPPQEEAKTPQAGLQVKVSLAPELAGRTAPEDNLFVFAKALQGPPMPLAVVRKQVKDLPATIQLDDSLAMMPELRLSGFPEVVVGARISKSGNAIPESGDLQGEIKPVQSNSTEAVKVMIDNIRP